MVCVGVGGVVVLGEGVEGVFGFSCGEIDVCVGYCYFDMVFGWVELCFDSDVVFFGGEFYCVF